MKKNGKHWWQEVVVYQIYPRSFKDSNGDGIGDLPELLKIGLFETLGIGAICYHQFINHPMMTMVMTFLIMKRL